MKDTGRFKLWNVLSAAEVVQPPQKEGKEEPGPKFDWGRLTAQGLALNAQAEMSSIVVGTCEMHLPKTGKYDFLPNFLPLYRS